MADCYRDRASTFTRGRVTFHKCGIPSHLEEISSRHSSPLNAATASTSEGRTFCGYHGGRSNRGFGPYVRRYQPQIIEYIQNASDTIRSGPFPFQVCGSSPPCDCLTDRNVSSTGQCPK